VQPLLRWPEYPVGSGEHGAEEFGGQLVTAANNVLLPAAA
jgi:hypothetical protein